MMRATRGIHKYISSSSREQLFMIRVCGRKGGGRGDLVRACECEQYLVPLYTFDTFSFPPLLRPHWDPVDPVCGWPLPPVVCV
jgi:hypothetical protein